MPLLFRRLRRPRKGEEAPVGEGPADAEVPETVPATEESAATDEVPSASPEGDPAPADGVEGTEATVPPEGAAEAAPEGTVEAVGEDPVPVAEPLPEPPSPPSPGLPGPSPIADPALAAAPEAPPAERAVPVPIAPASVPPLPRRDDTEPVPSAAPTLPTSCFLCGSRLEGGYCPVCRMKWVE